MAKKLNMLESKIGGVVSAKPTSTKPKQPVVEQRKDAPMTSTEKEKLKNSIGSLQ